jgi:hypothetical protein
LTLTSMVVDVEADVEGGNREEIERERGMSRRDVEGGMSRRNVGEVAEASIDVQNRGLG